MSIVTLIGLAAATLTTMSLIPQAVKVIKTRHTKDLSLAMYSGFTIGIALWLVYGAMVNDIPIIAANAISIVFAATILIMKLKYK
jgi:MtN3 and saliva related transmembrane protein